MASRNASVADGLRRLVGRGRPEPTPPATAPPAPEGPPVEARRAGIGVAPNVPRRFADPLTPEEQEVVDAFHRLYRHRRPDKATFFLGHRLVKCPTDLWAYQELVAELVPDLIVETGTLHGGSALYLATLLDIVDNGRIVSIDLDANDARPDHPRLTYLRGSSTAPEIVEQVRAMAAGARSVLVILDSDHRHPHVLDELRTYHDLVTPGSYIVVEDGNVNGHPVEPEFGPGPWEAVDDFLAENQDFELDPVREKHLITWNPHGYLRKRR